MSENQSNNPRRDMKYYSNKEMNKIYPEGGFRVLGEILGDSYKANTTIRIKPLKSYNKILYKKVGYRWSEAKQGYIVIKKNNIASLALYGLLTVSVIFLSVFGVNRLFNQSSIDPESEPFESPIKRPEEMSDSRILIPGYNDWNMLSGTKEVSVALFNPDENPCYFQFSVILVETGEILYQTGLIPPGEAVTTVRLPRTLGLGVHPITLKVDSFSLEDETIKYNSGEVKTNIVVAE